MKGFKKHDKKDSVQQPAVGEGQASADLPSAKLKEVLQNIQSLTEKAQKADEYKDHYLRALADLDNFRKRSMKERSQAVDMAQMEVIRGLLPILDNLERALAQLATDPAAKKVQEGLQLIGRQTQSFLEAIGVKPFSSVGEIFDPHKHEAVAHVQSSEHPDHSILEEVQRGYMLRDRILRHALVKVVDNPAKVPPSGTPGPVSQPPTV